MDLKTLDKAVADVAALTVSQLVELDALLDAETAALKRRKDTFHAVMVRLFDERAKRELTAAGKDTGTVNVMASNSTALKVNFPKKVEWDQKLLGAALNAMKPEEARHYGKVELSVEERKFGAAPPAVQAALRSARTVKVGKPTFSFAADDAEAA